MNFELNGDMKELLNKTGEPLRAVHFYNYKGTKKKTKARCEICAFCDVSEDEENLICTKSGLTVLEHLSCTDFNITRQMLNDLYHGCMS